MSQTFKVPEIGDVIADKYRIEAQIGKGGFGVVFKAIQLGMERAVAVKTLLPQAMAHEDMVERFRREAVHARNLNHPNTIRLYDFGQTDGGLLYIAMEYLDGRPLDALMKNGGPLNSMRVKNIAIQILKSLAEAHQNGIVHRDLKPANIFIIEVVGEDDFVKVLDFGIAKAFEEDAESGLTKTGIGFGTPFYMAPEQVRGRDIVPATDLYALGLLMAECLTGETVYGGTSSMEIAVKQLSEEPPPIPEWVLRGPLGPVIQRATQKDIRLRYPSAVEMLRDLKGIDPNATIDISTKLSTGAIVKQAEAEQKKGLPTGLLLGLGGVAALIVLLSGSLVAILASGVLDDKPEAASTVVEADTDEDKEEADKEEEDKELADKEEADKEEADKKEEEEKIVATVKTQPEGASIFDGEEFLGVSPLEVNLEQGEGSRDLELKMDGFKTAKLEVALSKDDEYNLELEVDDKVPAADNDKKADRLANRRKNQRDKRAALARKDNAAAKKAKKDAAAKKDDGGKKGPLIPKIWAGGPNKKKDGKKGGGSVSIPKL